MQLVLRGGRLGRCQLPLDRAEVRAALPVQSAWSCSCEASPACPSTPRCACSTASIASATATWMPKEVPLAMLPILRYLSWKDFLHFTEQVLGASHILGYSCVHSPATGLTWRIAHQMAPCPLSWELMQFSLTLHCCQGSQVAIYLDSWLAEAVRCRATSCSMLRRGLAAHQQVWVRQLLLLLLLLTASRWGRAGTVGPRCLPQCTCSPPPQAQSAAALRGAWLPAEPS